MAYQLFEPLVRGGLFNFQLPMRVGPCFFLQKLTRDTSTELPPSSFKGRKVTSRG